MGAVSGDDKRVVGKRHQLFERLHHHGHAAAGEVGTSDGSREKGVSAQKELVFGEVVANSSRGVARGVDDFADFQVVHIADAGRNSDGGVFARHLVEGMPEHHRIRLVDVDRKTGEQLLEFGDSRYVVEVGVSKQDCLRHKAFFLEKRSDARSFMAGIYDPCLAVFGDD